MWNLFGQFPNKVHERGRDNPLDGIVWHVRRLQFYLTNTYARFGCQIVAGNVREKRCEVCAAA